jgi:hypothetical protein
MAEQKAKQEKITIEAKPVVPAEPVVEVAAPPSGKSAAWLIQKLHGEGRVPETPFLATDVWEAALRFDKPQTAEDVLAILKREYGKVPDLQGTYRKAMKIVHGPDWTENGGAGLESFQNEIKLLRRENHQLKQELQVRDAQLAGERKYSAGLEVKLSAQSRWEMERGEPLPTTREQPA